MNEIKKLKDIGIVAEGNFIPILGVLSCHEYGARYVGPSSKSNFLLFFFVPIH